MIVVSGRYDEALLVSCGANRASVVYEKDDNAAIARLLKEARGYDPSEHEGCRLDVTLLLQSALSLRLLQTAGVPEGVNARADILAATREDLLAKNLLVRLPGTRHDYPSLDRLPIGRDSDVTVHLVVFGFTPMAEALAVNAALVAHYPNYCRDTRLRTRITIVDRDLYEHRNRFILRYSQLFDNSWYRTIDLLKDTPSVYTHRPQYASTRKDFVDVEWEFVRGDISDGALRKKLSEWSASRQQLLTIAMCLDDDAQNLEAALALPEAVMQSKTPVLCHADEDAMMGLATNDERYASIIPFGEKACDLSVLWKLRDLGMRVNYVYNHCFNLAPGDPVTAPASIDKERLEPMWRKVGSLPKQYSNIYNAMTLGTKMHSIGHVDADWKAYYALSKDEIDILTEVEHNRWSVEELILGYRPCTDDEQRLVDGDVKMKKVLRRQKIHYDLRAFDDLREDITGKNVNVYDMALTQAIPLIIKSCITG